ncbi:hypothetical protein BV25DRAFT_1888832 [Artomyces pyxidatus]|uniref:Uncharacterized protein n=1 Tax=Artomyces pyxidatus TaxID=48021 RepID=A0ACB8SVH9_9AGAM|nr:hypothetical protein BV25DRAFT_1888832 [Artomyces pyxidatus]
MALQRHTRSVDGTIPVPALLYDDEDNLASQEGVGIYDGTQKAPNHQNGTVYVTSHRLFYIDSAKPRSRSFTLDLSSIVRTEYYAGLFTSSSKVTIHLNTVEEPSTSTNGDAASESWVCEVCNFRNPPGSSPTGAKCNLCGVPRAKSGSGVSTPRPVSAPPSSSTLHVSTSLPTSPSHTPVPSEIPCPACTFLNAASRLRCEICDTQLPRSQPPLKSAPASRPTTPGPDDAEDSGIMKLSFRKGGDKALYALLKRSLLGKAWEVKEIGKRVEAPGPERFGGIDSLVRGVQTSAQSRQLDMYDALKDLDALMIKAREMVRLAGELNERLTASASATVNEEETFIRSSLVQLGLQLGDTPITLDMIRDEKRWHEELARELAGVLQGTGAKGSVGMMGERGIIGLDEVWGGWNRARGVALITPAQFLQVLPHLHTYTQPVVLMRKFPTSGLSVLHTPAYTGAAFAARLHGQLLASGARTTLEVAWEENVPVGLVAEMIGEAEAQGTVCRDVAQHAIGVGGKGGGEVWWWTNVFQGYVWDGQE